MTTKIVDARGGDDVVQIGIVRDDGGAIVNSAPAAKMRIDGGSNNDDITAGGADDIIYGGPGNDRLAGCGGRDVLRGNDGNDIISSFDLFRCAASPDDTVGSILCGDGGHDLLFGVGPAHQCLDAGSGQLTPPPGTFDCSYTFFLTPARAQTAFDLATARNCVNPSVPLGGESCSCETSLPAD